MTDEPAGDILSVEPIEGGLRVVGQVDLSNVELLRDAIGRAASGASELVLDLSECTYMGSEGIGALIEAVRWLGHGRLILRSPSGILMKVLDLAGITKLPNVHVAPG